MPIRMVDDPGKSRGPEDNNPGRRKPGGGGGAGSLLPMLLGLLFRYPKLLIPVLLIGGFVLWRGGCNLPVPGLDQAAQGTLVKGCEMKEDVYKEAMIFAALSDNQLPDAVSLLQYAPKAGNQGAQGSCVAWASGYAARTMLWARQTGRDPNTHVFSPAFLYNQIRLPDCQGSYIQRAMDNMQEVGAVRMSDFPYDPSQCEREPGASLRSQAAAFKIQGFTRLTTGRTASDLKTDPESIKQHLRAGSPVVIGMMVGGSFMQEMLGKKIWIPTRSDYDMPGFGGHAMCIVGYDDNLTPTDGGFQIFNSWGPEWGENGVAWVRYKDFEYFNKEAYGLEPMGAGGLEPPTRFEAEFGLVESESGRTIPLTSEGGNRFQTARPVAINTRFKVRVKNNEPCYTYIFGQETNDSSYILFPYTEKHSPYCGVTGNRVFPRFESLMPDAIGTRDYMAVLITRTPVDYQKVNAAINRNLQRDFGRALEMALQGQLTRNIQYLDLEGQVGMRAEAGDKNGVLMVIAVNKR